jgi:hypothetical protein
MEIGTVSEIRGRMATLNSQLGALGRSELALSEQQEVGNALHSKKKAGELTC